MTLSDSKKEQIQRTQITEAFRAGHLLRETNLESALELGATRKSGKVRDLYMYKDKLIAVTTDRQSAYDKVLAAIPFKGRVLSQVSAHWFKETADIVPNALLATPHPNVSVMRRLDMHNAEFIVRGYLTGVSATSVWTAYARGDRTFAGYQLDEGMVKNQAFAEPLVTPSTKSDHGDRTVSGAELVSMGILTEKEWAECRECVLALFRRGQEVAARQGLILVDTKYELGRDPQTGALMLADEVHTPDSSRYWLADEYKERLERGEEPKYIDKELLRIWLRDRLKDEKDAYAAIHAGNFPAPPEDLLVEMALRYITLYEQITGKDFEVDPSEWAAAQSGSSIASQIEGVLKKYLNV